MLKKSLIAAAIAAISINASADFQVSGVQTTPSAFAKNIFTRTVDLATGQSVSVMTTQDIVAGNGKLTFTLAEGLSFADQVVLGDLTYDETVGLAVITAEKTDVATLDGLVITYNTAVQALNTEAQLITAPTANDKDLTTELGAVTNAYTAITTAETNGQFDDLTTAADTVLADVKATNKLVISAYAALKPDGTDSTSITQPALVVANTVWL